MTGQIRNILITGGGTGLGRALTLHYAAPGITIAISGRRLEPLEEVAALAREKGAAVIVRTLDVKDSEATGAFVREVDANHPLDLVIANAGIGIRAQTPADRAWVHDKTWDVNIKGVANTVFPALEGMQARKSGRIAIMASLASFISFPESGAYNSSKAAARFFGEALRGELWKEGIAVTTICPGFVETPMTAKNRFPMPFLMTPEKAARIMARGIKKRKGRIVYPWRLYLIIRLFEILPYPLRDLILRKR